jgi:hypothetical protein
MIIYYRFADNQPYQLMVMAEETSTNLPSGMKNFSVSVDAPTDDAVLDYYLLSENAGTVLFLPREYTSKPFKVKLSDLNK